MRGIIDYRQADWHNPMWWKRWRYLIGGLEKQTFAQLAQLTYDYQLALMSNSVLVGDTFSKVQTAAKEIFTDIQDNARPWQRVTKEARHKQEVTDFKQQWKQLVGFDLNDRAEVIKWEESLRTANTERVTAQQAAAAAERDRLNSFSAKVEEIRQKRLKQQGRK